MDATENKDAAQPTLARASPRCQPKKTRQGGGFCCRCIFKHAVSRIICCSDVHLGAKEAKKGGGTSGLKDSLVCCSNVECDSDPEDDQELKGCSGGGGGPGGDWVVGESVSICCSKVSLKKKEQQQKK